MRKIAIGYWMLGGALLCQTATGPVFEAASVKTSGAIQGGDGEVTTDPGRFTARNTTLKRLIFEAWHMPYSRIEGGPGWLDSDEFDIDAKTENPVGRRDLDFMLLALLADRFKLATHRNSREMRVLALVIAKGGPKLRRAKDGDARADNKQGTLYFRSDLNEFASRLANSVDGARAA